MVSAVPPESPGPPPRVSVEKEACDEGSTVEKSDLLVLKKGVPS